MLTLGSTDPYAFTEHGAGFALTWLRGVQFRIGYPNDERETIQAESQELMVVIPDMTELHDGAAIGNETEERKEPNEDAMIQRRYTKPCARFVGGIRIGYGFYFERTCRKETCKANCGDENNKALRKCRFFDFKRHQDVILRNPAAMAKLVESGMVSPPSALLISPPTLSKASGRTLSTFPCPVWRLRPRPQWKNLAVYTLARKPLLTFSPGGAYSTRLRPCPSGKVNSSPTHRHQAKNSAAVSLPSSIDLTSQTYSSHTFMLRLFRSYGRSGNLSILV